MNFSILSTKMKKADDVLVWDVVRDACMGRTRFLVLQKHGTEKSDTSEKSPGACVRDTWTRVTCLPVVTFAGHAKWIGQIPEIDKTTPNIGYAFTPLNDLQQPRRQREKLKTEMDVFSVHRAMYQISYVKNFHLSSLTACCAAFCMQRWIIRTFLSFQVYGYGYGN